MKLTGGQTYFFIFCVSCIAVVFVRGVFEIIRIKMVSCGPCKALKREVKHLEASIESVRRLAVLAYNRTAIPRKERNAG